MKNIGLIFAGQGAQKVGMGKDLVEVSEPARRLFAKADQELGSEFSKICFEGPEETLTETRYCQPALYVHGLALLAELQARQPTFSFSHAAGLSLGEFTAHAAAGTFSFEDGLKLVARRGQLMQEACENTEGGMLALLGATPDSAAQLAEKVGIDVANFNNPGQIVLSGARDKIPEAVAAAKEFGIRRAMPLKVAGAYHSRLMQPAQDSFQPALAQTEMSESEVMTFANFKGGPVSDVTEIRDTLLNQITGSVRWQQCVEAMIEDGVDLLVELGPGKVLSGMCKKINPDVPCVSIGTLADLEGAIDELK